MNVKLPIQVWFNQKVIPNLLTIIQPTTEHKLITYIQIFLRRFVHQVFLSPILVIINQYILVPTDRKFVIADQIIVGKNICTSKKAESYSKKLY